MSLNRATALRREGLQAQLLEEPRKHPPHERGKSDASEAVIEGFVRDLHAVLVIEGAE
jgi:hypothetical protein